MKSLKQVTKIFLVAWLFIACDTSEFKRDYPESFSVSLTNNTNRTQKDVAIELEITQIQTKHPDFNFNSMIVLHRQQELASQVVDMNRDGKPEQIIFTTDFSAKEEKTITIRYSSSGVKTKNYPKRTQAEVSHKIGGKFENRKYIGGKFQNVNYVRVPPEHTDHSLFFRYEGPGWESDKVGYRFYLDWRNATDIFGKKVPQMVLQDVGQDGFDSYHEMADWGMDILKVGESLGIGSIGMWHDRKVFRVSQTDSIICRIIANGPVFSQIQTRYFGWQVGAKKFNLTSNLSITAGSRLTKHEVTISGEADNLCTGLVKHEEAEVLQSTDGGGDWAYFANYGKQSLAEDNLGMAILYKRSELIQTTEDELSHVLVLKPQNGKLIYYFLAAWEKELDGIKTQEAFNQYLDQTVEELNTPIAIDY